MTTLSQRPALSGRRRTSGALTPQAAPITLDPASNIGATVLGTDGLYYYSDGLVWQVPIRDIAVSRPRPLSAPSEADNARLGLTPYYSPLGAEQTGVEYEVYLTDSIAGAPFLARQIAGSAVSVYNILYPQDGLVPGQAFWWRARYSGDLDGIAVLSDWTSPLQRQVFPAPISRPVPQQFDGEVTGLLSVAPFASFLGLAFQATEFQVWTADGSALVAAHRTAPGLAWSPLPIAPDGAIAPATPYTWRARFEASDGTATPVVSEWSNLRAFSVGAAETVYVVDPAISATTAITLYTVTGDVTVDWGDGTSDTHTGDGALTHTYEDTSALCTVTVAGRFRDFRLGLDSNSVNRDMVVRINSLGYGHGLTTTRGIFRNDTGTSENLKAVPATIPNTITELYLHHLNLKTADGTKLNLGAWATAQVTSLTFRQARITGGAGIEGWNVSAINGFKTFDTCIFPEDDPVDLSAWILDTPTSLKEMFTGARGLTSGARAGVTGLPRIPDATVLAADSFLRNARIDAPIDGINFAACRNFARFVEANTVFDQDLGGIALNPAITSFDMKIEALSEETYSRSLIGWANTVYGQQHLGGPYGLLLSTVARRYNDAIYAPGRRFTNAVEARVFLVAPRGCEITGALNADHNGLYSVDSASGDYLKDDGSNHRFTRIGTLWTLMDPGGEVVSSTPFDMPEPYLATGWTGSLTIAQLRRWGAAWTITGDIDAS